MTVIAPPPKPSAPSRHPRAVDALIEEARRRARRRRQAYWGAALLLLAAGIGTYFGHGGSPSRPPARAGAERPGSAPGYAPLEAPKNGSLTVTSLPTVDRDQAPPGWYGVSTVDPRGGLRPLVRCPHHDEFCGEVESAAWAPDGRRIALSVTTIVVPTPYAGLHIVDTATGRDRQIAGPCMACDWQDLAWSPDGRRLAFVRSGSIYLINADGSGRRDLHTGTDSHDSSPSWSPDGKWIAYSTAVAGHSSVSVIRVDGSARRLLVRRGSAPAWSPDGRVIAYRRGCGIRLVTAAGRDATRPTTSNCQAMGVRGSPVWSPDGRELAVAGPVRNRWSTAPQGTWVMNADGTDLRLLTPSVGFGILGEQPRPTWQPRT